MGTQRLVFILHPLIWLGPAGSRNRMLPAGALIVPFLCFRKCLGNTASKEITCGQVRRKEIAGNTRFSVWDLHGFWPPRSSLAVALNMEIEAQAHPSSPCRRGWTHHTNVPGRCFSGIEAVNCWPQKGRTRGLPKKLSHLCRRPRQRVRKLEKEGRRTATVTRASAPQSPWIVGCEAAHVQNLVTGKPMVLAVKNNLRNLEMA